MNHSTLARICLRLKQYTWKWVFLVAGMALLAGCRQAENHTDRRSAGHGEFSFIVFGDNRWDTWPAPVPPALLRIVDEVNRLNPDFAVETGDLVLSATPQEFDQYLEAVRRLQVPIHHVMGNHDANIDLWKKLIDRRLFYSFDHKGSHFVVLNCYLPGDVGKVGGYQLTWLEKDLEAHKEAAHTFVFVHEPLYPVGPYKGGAIDEVKIYDTVAAEELIQKEMGQ